MKRYCGCISPTERRKRPCEDEERNSAKNIAASFQAAIFFVLRSVCGTEGNLAIELNNKLSIYRKCSYGIVWLTDWNSRTEQRERL